MRMFSFAVLVAVTSAAALAGAAHADTFVNGSFEGGTIAGWTRGRLLERGGPIRRRSNICRGGSAYNPSGIEISVTNAGFDPNTGNNLRTAYAGQHSARVNSPSENYSVSVLSQRVNNYTGPLIAFAYAAVLESSHGATDSDAFIITLQDLTTNNTLFTYNLNSATAPGLFGGPATKPALQHRFSTSAGSSR